MDDKLLHDLICRIRKVIAQKHHSGKTPNSLRLESLTPKANLSASQRSTVNASLPDSKSEQSTKPLETTYLVNGTDQTPDEIYLRKQLAVVFSCLTEREQEVLGLCFGFRDGQTRSLAEIGRMLNLTRERVRQIEASAFYKLRHSGSQKSVKQLIGLSHPGVFHLLSKMSLLLSLTEAANLLQCDRKTLLELIEIAELKTVRAQDDEIFLRLEDLRPIKQPLKRCIVCGLAMPPGHSLYCSNACAKQRRSYHNWSEERKTKHRELVKKWHQEHPEQSRAIHTRASQKYQRKSAELRRLQKTTAK